jgi:hypothetical protein
MQALSIRIFLGAGVLTLVGAAALSGQGVQPPPDAVTAELRALRADLNERLEANIRVQLLVAKLQLQEQRTAQVVRQLSDVQDKLRSQEQTKAQIDAAKKMFGIDPNKPESPEDEKNFILAPLRAQLEQMAKAEGELRQQEMDLTNTLGQEQARWAAFNAKLEELERMFDKRR